MATRFVHSIGQGALAVDLRCICVRSTGRRWRSVLLSAALMIGVVLTLFAGPLSDRGARKRFLFAYGRLKPLPVLLHWSPRNLGFFVLLLTRPVWEE